MALKKSDMKYPSTKFEKWCVVNGVYKRHIDKDPNAVDFYNEDEAIVAQARRKDTESDYEVWVS